MNEARALLHAFRQAEARGLRSALALIIRVEGSSYRQPGAKMLILENGETAGAVSGGCLERDLIRRATKVLALKGRPERVTYDTRMDRDETDPEIEEDLDVTTVGLGCEGIIEILIEPAPATFFTALARALEERLDTPFHWPAPLGQTSYSDTLCAPKRLFAFGAGHDAVPLTRMARELGWDTTVVDCGSAFPQPRARFAHVDQFIRCAPEEAVAHAKCDASSIAIVMTHSLDHDREILRALLPIAPVYLALLGPRARGVRLAESLELANLEGLARFPAGLDLGGEGPESIALSVLSEAQAVLHQRAAGFLKDRIGPIHGRPGLDKGKGGDSWNLRSMARA